MAKNRQLAQAFVGGSNNAVGTLGDFAAEFNIAYGGFAAEFDIDSSGVSFGYNTNA